MNLHPLTTQPRGFYLLFAAEFCERYGFYTSAYLLVPYAMGTLGFRISKPSCCSGPIPR